MELEGLLWVAEDASLKGLLRVNEDASANMVKQKGLLVSGNRGSDCP